MTTATAITILGLGPGRWEDLTLQARALLEQAATDKKTVFFRTLIHPIIEQLKHEIPDLRITSFDSFYDEATDWDTLYQRIAQEICIQAEQHPPVFYAVPGHPLIGEASVQLIPTMPLLVAHIYHRRQASAVKLALGECYPDEWPVKLVRSTGLTASETVGEQGGDKPRPYITAGETVIEMPLYEIDRASLANHFNTLYIPPLEALDALRIPETLRYITMRLRRDPDGCPWDRQQTHQSLTRYVIEETYEVVEALEENDMEKLAEELGDLLLQVCLHPEIARQERDFATADVF